LGVARERELQTLAKVVFRQAIKFLSFGRRKHVGCCIENESSVVVQGFDEVCPDMARPLKREAIHLCKPCSVFSSVL
jgi:hypothetical protein